MKLFIFEGIFRISKFEFLKFRILEILNFHPLNMLWELKRNGSYEHPKQMFKLMDKKIFTILLKSFARLDLLHISELLSLVCWD